MTNKLIRFFLSFGAVIFTFFALSTSASACVLGYYQPEEPKCLREE
jgi:AgrD protein